MLVSLQGGLQQRHCSRAACSAHCLSKSPMYQRKFIRAIPRHVFLTDSRFTPSNLPTSPTSHPSHSPPTTTPSQPLALTTRKPSPKLVMTLCEGNHQFPLRSTHPHLEGYSRPLMLRRLYRDQGSGWGETPTGMCTRRLPRCRHTLFGAKR